MDAQRWVTPCPALPCLGATEAVTTAARGSVRPESRRPALFAALYSKMQNRSLLQLGFHTWRLPHHCGDSSDCRGPRLCCPLAILPGKSCFRAAHCTTAGVPVSKAHLLQGLHTQQQQPHRCGGSSGCRGTQELAAPPVAAGVPAAGPQLGRPRSQGSRCRRHPGHHTRQSRCCGR